MIFLYPLSVLRTHPLSKRKEDGSKIEFEQAKINFDGCRASYQSGQGAEGGKFGSDG